MSEVVVILDGFTVEPSGLGVPPFVSAYVRQAYAALRRAFPTAEVVYLTIDDLRWCLNGGRPFEDLPLSDALTYSATTHREQAIRLLADAAAVVVIAGDKVPSIHLHARNASPDELTQALAYVRGRRVLLGPLSTYAWLEPSTCQGLFDAIHSHTITSSNIFAGSRRPAPYADLRADRVPYDELLTQMRWRAIAEIELYRGCTRRRFCSFCNEPVKNAEVTFREPADVLDEITMLYGAGVRHFRLGQQTCFFSYLNRNVDAIERLLASIRDTCPELAVLHIDNADPLAVASPSGARIARHVATYCTEGNCAPMGIESFDPLVVARNALTCTPAILERAVATINDAGAAKRVDGLPQLLPGLNLIYGLPGETDRTHHLNLTGLLSLYDAGYSCHRTNVRQLQIFPGTELDGHADDAPTRPRFETCKDDITRLYEIPMKRRVYPAGIRLARQYAFFVTQAGTWFRRLGSYPIQIVERDTVVELRTRVDLKVNDHAGRYIYGERVA